MKPTEIDEGNSEKGGEAGARSRLASGGGSAYYAVVPSGDAVGYGGGGRAAPAAAAAAAVTYAILSDSATMYATPLPGNDPIAESSILHHLTTNPFVILIWSIKTTKLQLCVYVIKIK